MQVSIENLSGLERKMTVGVPSEKIEDQVQNRLQEAAKNVQLKGFRKGKVPLKVIKGRFGKGIRQEVLGEVMNQSYFEALQQEKIRPAGQPRIEPLSVDEGKDLEFVATFEVFPEISLGDFSAIRIQKKTAEIKDADLDNMIETLRKQRMDYKEADRPAAEEDKVNIDFVGRMDGETFEGGSAEGVDLVLGSKRMIEGFESGLIGAEKGKTVTLNLTFPENYQSQDLAGKAVEFDVTVNSVSEPVLPELNDEFYASFDVTEGGEEAFREEVKGNMARELKQAGRNNVKSQVIKGLVDLHEFTVPKSLLAREIDALREQAMQRFGGQAKVDKSMLPDDLFSEEATRRVKLGLLMNEIITSKELKADPADVRAHIEEMAESYEQPEEVIKWYYSDKEQMANIEAMVLENTVIESVLSEAQVTEVATDYEDALKPVQAEAKAEEAAEADAGAEKKAAKSKKKAKEAEAPAAEEAPEADADAAEDDSKD